jgi:hypothetical protein
MSSKVLLLAHLLYKFLQFLRFTSGVLSVLVHAHFLLLIGGEIFDSGYSSSLDFLGVCEQS